MMAPSVKNLSKKSQSSSKSKFNSMYALLRDQATDKLLVVPHKEMISSKASAKLDVGDIVNHEKSDKRIRAAIVLLGDEDQCRQSRQIMERMESSSSQMKTTNKGTSSNKANYHGEQIESENELEQQTRREKSREIEVEEEEDDEEEDDEEEDEDEEGEGEDCW